MSRQILPVATPAEVRRYAIRLMRRHPGTLARALGLQALAAVAGLAAPALLGDLVQQIATGTTASRVDRIALLIGACVLAQSVLMRFATFISARLGEQVLADLREEFVARVLDVPLSTIERAGTGDLITRTSRDVDGLSRSVRRAVPETLIAIITTVLTIGAMVIVSPLLALGCAAALPPLVVGTRWYLKRSTAAYLRVNAAYAEMTDGLAETVDGVRTVEALRGQRRRVARTDGDIAGSYAAELYALLLRTIWIPITEVSFLLPVVAILLGGGALAISGWVTLGQVTAATLYAQQLVDPLSRLLDWLEELQVGNASLARLLGVSKVPADRVATGAQPAGGELVAEDVRYAYTAGRDVLHGIDLRVRPGERLAVVGPSGAGKSTLGRLIAGIDGPRTGRIAVGGVPLIDLPLDELRGHVALVTQEHHVFVGTLAENVALARPDATDEEVRNALAAVDALDWALELPDGLSTPVGTGNLTLDPAQAQQVALARLVLADPHTLVLDEATSLIDPRAARHLERSLAGVLHGRTVIAIAHRLFSAHDADRVAVVEDGRISELGTHDDLVAGGGSYAALWRAWQAGSAGEADRSGRGDVGDDGARQADQVARSEFDLEAAAATGHEDRLP